MSCRSQSLLSHLSPVAGAGSQDSARDDLRQMLGARRKRRQVDEPAKGRHQTEKVIPSHIVSRHPSRLSLGEQMSPIAIITRFC